MVTARLAHVIRYITPGIEERMARRQTTKIVSGEEHGGQCP